MKTIEIKIQKVTEDFNDLPLPSYSTEGSSGLDLRAAVESEFILKKNSFALIPTNLRVEIPLGYEIQIRPRSGLAVKNGIGVLNSPGTIDSDYRGEIKIILFNFSEEDFIIKRGERIAQMVLSEVYKMILVEEENLNKSQRGDGGFGHTGKH